MKNNNPQNTQTPQTAEATPRKKIVKPRKEITKEQIEANFHKSLKAAAMTFEVSPPTLKRYYQRLFNTKAKWPGSAKSDAIGLLNKDFRVASASSSSDNSTPAALNTGSPAIIAAMDVANPGSSSALSYSSSGREINLFAEINKIPTQIEPQRLPLTDVTNHSTLNYTSAARAGLFSPAARTVTQPEAALATNSSHISSQIPSSITPPLLPSFSQLFATVEKNNILPAFKHGTSTPGQEKMSDFEEFLKSAHLSNELS